MPKQQVRLLKDIVIPAGTIFNHLPFKSQTEICDDEHFEFIVGLTKDSYGTLVYCVDGEDDPEIKKWFEPV